MSTSTDDLRIRGTNQLISPEQLIAEISVSVGQPKQWPMRARLSTVY